MSEPRIGSAPCRVRGIQHHGWRAVQLTNGLIAAVLVPDIGGRIMAYDLGPCSYLWVNHALLGRTFSPEENVGDGSIASWRNYGGSKTWPAPQGWETDDQWHGPPDPVLDTGRYAVEKAECSSAGAMVRVRSPEDPRTGVQIVRQLTLHPGGTHATLHLEMLNVSDRFRTWSLSDVVQLDAARRDENGGETHNDHAWLYVPTNPLSRFPRGYRVIFGEFENPEWQMLGPGLLGAQYLYHLGKIGVDSPAGWLAFVNGDGDWAFCQRFTYLPGESYPDGGASVECWTTGLGPSIGGLDYERDRLYHVEAEVLGPLRRLAPGEMQSLDIEWCAARCPGPILNVSEVGCCHQPLQVAPVGEAVRLRGTYGVFYDGEVQLLWLDGADSELARENIALANPLGVLMIDLVRRPPDAAARARLDVTVAGQPLGPLDKAALHAR